MMNSVKTVGRYELLDPIGYGGMAVVYLARQTDLDRLVALKELRMFAAPDDPGLAERFLREETRPRVEAGLAASGRSRADFSLGVTVIVCLYGTEEEKAAALRDAGFDMRLDSEAFASIQYQNANNSVRVTDEFMERAEHGEEWELTASNGGEVIDRTALSSADTAGRIAASG